jgi:hypothetical protein
VSMQSLHDQFKPDMWDPEPQPEVEGEVEEPVEAPEPTPLDLVLKTPEVMQALGNYRTIK